MPRAFQGFLGTQSAVVKEEVQPVAVFIVQSFITTGTFSGLGPMLGLWYKRSRCPSSSQTAGRPIVD